MKILMVCLGNICRSPLAHGIFEELANQKNLNWTIDSAGTGNWHIGHAPDRRAIQVAKENGIDISNQKAQQFNHTYFNEYDVIFAMDENNYRDILNLAKTEEDKNKVKLFIPDGVVPDPYYDDTLFNPVYELIYNQSLKWIEELSNSN